MRKIPVLVLLLTLLVAAAPSAAAQQRVRGSFVARALPLPLVGSDIYYPGKASCLGGLDGINYVSEPFEAPAEGELRLSATGFTGDWDIYVLNPGGGRLAQSEGDQTVGGDAAEEKLSVPLDAGQPVEMVACNWLGEPELEVHYEFELLEEVQEKKVVQEATTTVTAGGGPAALLWRWEPKTVMIRRGEKVTWENPTITTHHVTAYAGPWIGTGNVASGAKFEKRFGKPGTYSYRCDIRYHSELVNGECAGMCGEIVVRGRRRS